MCGIVGYIGPQNAAQIVIEGLKRLEYRGYDSAGLAVQWLAPLGVFRFSYAFPINASDGDAVNYPDETESFQFSIGQAF